MSKQFSAQSWRSPLFWIVGGSFGLVSILEFSTPPDYVMGYLYISPILIANSRLSRTVTFQFVLAAVILTLLNIWIPDKEIIQASTVANRLIYKLYQLTYDEVKAIT